MFAIPREQYRASCEKFLRADFSYDALVEELLRLSKGFPPESPAWPSIVKRVGGKILMRISAHLPESKDSICGGRRYPHRVISSTLLEGDLKDIGRQAMEITIAAKNIAEALMVIEECSAEQSNT